MSYPRRTSPAGRLSLLRKCTAAAGSAVLLLTSCEPTEAPKGGSKKDKDAAPVSSNAPPARPLDALKKRTYAIALHDDLIHLGTTAGVVTKRYAGKGEPKELAHLTLAGSVVSLTLFGDSADRLAVATGPTGLAFIDTRHAGEGKLKLLNRHPWSPEMRGECTSVWQMRTSNGKDGALACGTGGVAGVDLRKPHAPIVGKAIDVGGTVRDVALLSEKAGAPAGNRRLQVVAAAGRAGLVVVDVGSVGAPRIVSRFKLEGEARALVVREDLAYVASGAAGLQIVDLRQRQKPQGVGALIPPLTDKARGIAVAKDTAYLCAGQSGLFVIDVSAPATPKQKGQFDPERALNRVVVRDTLAFAANDADGLLILDTTDPRTPRQVFPPSSAR